jgi:hypothetical protein
MAKLRKYFVTKSGLGYQEGVYEAKELKKLPKSAHQNIIPLSVAITKHLVEPDYNSGENINELALYSPTNPKTGKAGKTLKGTSEGKKPSFKLGNKLRDKVQAKKASNKKGRA